MPFWGFESCTLEPDLGGRDCIWHLPRYLNTGHVLYYTTTIMISISDNNAYIYFAYPR